MICNRDFNVQISFQNKSVYPASGDLVINYSDLFSFVSGSVPPDEESAGHLRFNNLTIEPFAWKNIKLTFTAPGLMGQGIVGEFESSFYVPDSVFTTVTMDSVRCSYDPNDKKVEAVGPFFRQTSLIGDPLKYTIRFQNEGNYKAFDIVIIDTLDSRFNPSTFELLASSHAVEVTISPVGILKFVFPNIDLSPRSEDEAGSQGFVSFTIMADSSLAPNQDVSNKASIYFDSNQPIQTNTTVWHLTDDLSIVSIEDPAYNISIYPNPTNHHLFIETTAESIYQVFDVAGKWVGAGQLQEGRNRIQLAKPTGIYFLQVTDRDGRRMVEKVEKVVKM